MFLASAHVAKDNGHVCVDFITTRLSNRTRSILEIITYSWSVLFCTVLVYSAIRMVYISVTQSILDNTVIALPLAIPQSAFALGVTVLTLQLIKITVMNLYVIKGTTGDKLEEVMKGALPFLLVLLLSLLIVGLYQPLSTWLPSTMMQ